MGRLFRRVCVIGTGAVAACLMLATVVAAQGSSTAAVHNAHRLGGSTSFYAPPLRTAASLKQMAAKKGMADDIRTVLRESGIPETADAVLATLAGATSFRGASCDIATPADGTVVECDFQPGSTMVWMAYRPHAGMGNRTPGRIENVRWVGNKPFKAFLFRVTNDYRIYTFILPLVCSNLSLVSVTDVEREPVDVSVDRVCDPTTGSLRATIKADGKELARVQRVNVAVNGRPAGELSAPSWTLVATTPGDYTFQATDRRGQPYPLSRQSIREEACPPPPPAPMKQVVGPTCSVVLSALRVKGGYQIHVDATRSTTGTSTVAPTVTVELRGDSEAAFEQKLVIDASLNGTITVRRAGTYHATATVSTPQAVEVGASRFEGSATCEASVTVERPAGGPSIFFDVLGGKDRRVRPIENTDLEFAQCSPLLGLKVGVAKRFGNNWEVAGAAGVAISLVTDNEKVKESELFVDAEVNKYVGSGVFIGTGLSLWDLTRSDTWTPAWLLHFGVPLNKAARHQVYFFGEGRVFFDHIDDVKNNYQVWGGVRVHFRR